MGIEFRSLRDSKDLRGFKFDLIPRDPNIASNIKSGTVVVDTILKGRAPLYLEAGLGSGFEVRIIAEIGQAYVHGVIHSSLGLIVEETRLEKEGYLAVSIEKPEGNKSFQPFWDNLKSLEQKKA